jgi:hypothetical protein
MHFNKWNYSCEFWKDLIRFKLGVIISIKTWWFFLFYEYIYQKIIYVIEYEKWEIYFKSGVVSDFLHETLGGDHEWYW